ncbi:MAG: NAD-dependent protein deacylase [Acidimicrobiales bacterium]|nr:NAD-dependent protein deacylase [Acidimicrobiales bacterium]
MSDLVPDTDAVERARRILSGATSVTVLTGAGISTDSGIPDFRGPQGVWTKNPEAEKLATLQHYLSDPDVRRRAWRSRLENRSFGAEPNAGHLALADLEAQGRLHTLITQNVDGLHQKAGNSADRVVEIHGTLHEVMCLSCDERAPMQRALDRVRAGEDDPECRSCGGILKSATVSFGQSLDQRALARAEVAAQECEVMLAVGSTLTVYPIAEVVPVAKSAGAEVVIVNGSETAFDQVADAAIRGSISEVLPTIVGRGAG